jgi:DNA-binding transcriptional LysR family regulator
MAVPVDLKNLLTFRTVAEKGSFSLAAEQLEISQPAVSLQIRALERLLGHRLLDRRGRRLTLTEAGGVVYRYAARMLTMEDELTHELEAIGTRVAGRLVIGSSTGLGEDVLPRVCAAFRSAHPDVTVSLVVQDSQSVCRRVLDGELELGVVGVALAQRGLVFEPFLHDELVLITPPDHPLAGRERVRLEELVDVPLLLQQEGSGVRAVLEAALRARGLRTKDMNVAMELGLQQSVKSAVLDGVGVTVISRLAVEREVADGRLVALELEGPGLARDFHSVRRAGRTLSRLPTLFLDFARERIGAGPAAAVV